MEIPVIFLALVIVFWPMFLLTHGVLLALGLQLAWFALIPVLLWLRKLLRRFWARMDARHGYPPEGSPRSGA